jgi:hypothetical protein
MPILIRTGGINVRNHPLRIIHATVTQGRAAAVDSAEGRSSQARADGLPVSARIVCCRCVCYGKADPRLPTSPIRVLGNQLLSTPAVSHGPYKFFQPRGA